MTPPPLLCGFVSDVGFSLLCSPQNLVPITNRRAESERERERETGVGVTLEIMGQDV